MPTTVHIPKDLLRAVDRRARALKLSRNRLIVRALEREVDARGEWSPGFFDLLRELGPRNAKAVDAMAAAIRRNRRSKGPPEL